jgi:hypothetical protein
VSDLDTRILAGLIHSGEVTTLPALIQLFKAKCPEPSQRQVRACVGWVGGGGGGGAGGGGYKPPRPHYFVANDTSMTVKRRRRTPRA